ncbi:MAG: hypothetical protein EHM23_22945 [Acidobacteria bacterium]|nr:MAG: hypothetical protein EHM23_22945 [Acidobacteriota bacterium]
MKLIAYLAAGFLLGLVYFLITTAGFTVLTLLTAIGIGIGSASLWRLLDSEETTPPLLNGVLLAAAATLLGLLISRLFVAGGSGAADWLGVVLAAGAAALMGLLRTRRSVKVCFVCKKPMTEADSVTCPRCQQGVCLRPGCWQGRLLRCSSCHEREVILFPDQEGWWAVRTGRRLAEGQCNSCYREAQEADLRECGKCHWPMCKRCWDYHNGECPRCHWSIPNLPPQLTPFVGTGRRDRR